MPAKGSLFLGYRHLRRKPCLYQKYAHKARTPYLTVGTGSRVPVPHSKEFPREGEERYLAPKGFQMSDLNVDLSVPLKERFDILY